VNDALKMMRWLIDSKTCKVLPQNLYLLTSPAPPANEPIPPGVRRKDATFASLVRACDELVTLSKGEGDKLFVYFSGHGLTNDSALDAEEALVMTDFTDVFTDNAAEVRSLIDYFKAMQFRQQFFIVDACRDVPPWDGKFRTRPIPLVKAIDPNLPAVQQYTLMATSPRIRAAAIGGKSAFTEELLNGLKGASSAVVLDINTNEYIISTSRLFKFVEKQIADRKINVSGDPDKPRWQKPRIGGEHGSEDPEWARLSVDDVDKASLRIFVEPDVAWPNVLVTIVDQFGDEKRRINPITKAPEDLPLPPMLYTARTSAPGYKAVQDKWPIELSGAQDLVLKLVESPDSGETKAVDQVVLKGLRGPRPKAGTADLKVTAGDSLARLELADSQGVVLQSAERVVFASELEPGFYRARLLTPEGKVIEKLVELGAGEQASITLEAPRVTDSSLKALADANRVSLLGDSSSGLDLMTNVRPLAFAQFSTVLALSGTAGDSDEMTSKTLRVLGFKSFTESVGPTATAGLQILAGYEAENSPAQTRLSEMRLRVRPIAQSPDEAQTVQIGKSSLSGVYDFAREMAPGNYCLSVELPDQAPVDFAIAILAERVTMLIFQPDNSGRLQIFQYSSSLSPEAWKQITPDDVRRLDLAQRFYLSGRLDYAYETAQQLLYAKWIDPLAGCLGCYLMLSLGKVGDLDVAANNMVKYYGDLCDSHILKAEFEASKGNTEVARGSIVKALDLGVPVFAEGLTRVYAALQKYELQGHKRARLLSEIATKRVRGLLWTAWTPSKEVRPVEGLNVVGDLKINIGDRMNAGRDIFKVEGDLNMPGRDYNKVEGNYYASRDNEAIEIGVMVPDVVGLERLAAITKIIDHDQLWIQNSWITGKPPLLQIGETRYERSPERSGTVIRQNPKAGEMVARDKRIDLVIGGE
jgi:hypothetical protein